MAWLPRISQKLQKQNELPIVDLKNQDMRISFCKKVEMELTFNPHAVVGKPKIGAQFWGQIQILTSSRVQKSKQASTIIGFMNLNKYYPNDIY